MPCIRKLSFSTSGMRVKGGVPIRSSDTFALVTRTSGCLIGCSLAPSGLMCTGRRDIMLCFKSMRILVKGGRCRVEVTRVGPVLRGLGRRCPSRTKMLRLRGCRTSSTSVGFAPRS